jgi:homoserine dehydrogenase
LAGYGRVGLALHRLILSQRARIPLRVVGIQTLRHGSAFDQRGLPLDPEFGPLVAPIGEFLDRARPEVLVEATTLQPATGEPALEHLLAAFERGRHVVTANLGPVAHAYAVVAHTAQRSGVQFRIGLPLFQAARLPLPGAKVAGFRAVLSPASSLMLDALRAGRTLADGMEAARTLGLAEGDASYYADGWDAALQAAALANVLFDARITPLQVNRRGIAQLTPEKLDDLRTRHKTVALVARGRLTTAGVSLRVRAEVLDVHDPLASTRGASSVLLLDTDLAGTVGSVVDSAAEQTAYALFRELVDIAG